MAIIIKIFSPEYFVCFNNCYYFIIELTNIIASKFMDISDNYDKIFNLFSELFAILACLIYLEIIELNFCDLNYYLKKNIDKRGRTESNIENLYNDDDDDLNDLN